MREIACEQCGRRVIIGGDTVMCPSCGFTVRPEAQSPAAAPVGMDMGISGVETRVAAAPVTPAALAATAAPAAGGRMVCAQCGRGVMTDAGAAAVCPSCGFALNAPAAPAAADVSAMETRVAPMPALAPIAVAVETPAVAAMERVSAVDEAATRVAEAAPVAIAAQADTAATQPAAGGASTSPETPETRPAGMPYGQPPPPAPYPGQPGFGQQPPYGQPMYGQPHQAGMPPTATYPYSGYPGYPGYPAMSPVPPPPPQRKKTPVVLITVLVALAVVVVAGVLFAALILARGGGFAGAAATATAVPTATATPSPSAPVGFSTYSDANGAYSFNYPSGWRKTATSGDFSLVLFSGTAADSANAAFEVESQPGAGPQDKNAFVEQFLSLIATQTGGHISNKETPTQVSMAGESWTQEAADLSVSVGSQSAVEHVVIQVTTHGGSTFILAYLAPADTFASVKTQYFQPMLDSFKFLQ